MTKTKRVSSPKKKDWYKKPWGIVVAILIFPFFITWYAWAKSTWSKNTRIAVTAVACIFVVAVMIINREQPKPESSSNSEPPATVKTQPAQSPAFVYDIPVLLEKNIDEIRVVLGQPTDGSLSEPNEEQAQLGTDEWDNTFEKENQELLVTFNPSTRIVIDYFLSGEDKNELLEKGNLTEGDPRYKVEEVKALRGGGITGIKITAS